MLTQNLVSSQAVSVPRTQVTNRKTIKDVFDAARRCNKRTGLDCSVSPSAYFCHGTLRREWVSIAVNRGGRCETSVSIEGAIAFFEADDAKPSIEDVSELPAQDVVHIVCGPDADLGQLLRQTVTATAQPNDPDDRGEMSGSDWSIIPSHEIVVVDVLLLGEPDEQYDWEAPDVAYGRPMAFYANLVGQPEKDVDRVLATYRVTVKGIE